jgi:hypothetical protein
LAKGPTAATITGPGLEKPLRLGGGPNALANGTPMQVLMMRGGFFQVAFGSQPRRILAKSPTEDLGPKYLVVYVLPGPAGQEDLIHQELYPHARGGPVSYTRADQRFFGRMKTVGGWFRARPVLTTALVEAGLPAAPTGATATQVAGDDGLPPAAYAGILLALGLAAVAILAVRRSARPASA